MKKPTMGDILRVPALSEVPERGPDPIRRCNICGGPSDSLAAWREHDEKDQPMMGAQFLVFIAEDHPRCIRVMERHPRLYEQDRGDPGTFPALCGPCVHRSGIDCKNPNQKKLGGAGLLVKLRDPFGGARICGGRGLRRLRLLYPAVSCDGQEVGPCR